MKRLLSLFLFSLIFMGCKNDNSLVFEPSNFGNEPCANCASVSISIPKAIGNKKLDETINTALREEIIFILKYDDAVDAGSIDMAIKSFQNEFAKLKEKFPEESTQWEASINGEVSFENERMLTIRLDYYLFTGGAHGYGSTRFLNFDKTKATELNNEELFKDILDFEGYAEAKFREQEGISSTASINSTGFMFEEDMFYLPENMGFTNEGLQLFYEQYEVASYADGPIILTFPFEEIQKFLTLQTF
ncbi:DUF3298 and DUF4163 domain-containing protein [Maribacter flavus]|uniref:DUF3298 and DUF4163 domain-containing protein n=1 Tax=Maribacter flavus TaxID=1658664 RepID=A0A5B2TY56_9FLAO|nr:DUF3298 and DUF4163 domain-containing protein [Maribacter flavus]KAA2219476.1 DUF3298 and DUF4163 domain-containing protein [Maribacter flavus]